MAGVELNSARNDGFTTWDIKQDLYKLKFLLDEIMETSPTYGDLEQEFLSNESKRQVWHTLKK
jgi:hypothetical protein